jgi:glycosyltransferase involved in cell wall biosynthesis
VKPTDVSAERCIYVTSSWGVHDERWVSALRSVGFGPIAFSLGRDASTLDDLRALVEEAALSSTPVLAGPLTTITRSLVGVDAHLVGLSWGFDLYELEEEGALGWLSQLDGLVVDSQATQSIAEQAGVDPTKITMLPWGVDLELFTPIGAKANLTKFGIPADAQVILSARAHEPLYRVADVISGFALVENQIPKAHLLVTHQGSLTSELEQLAADLGVSARVHFIGKVAEVDLPEIMRACSCYVTAASVDGTSVTLLQAMACKVPVVVSDSPGNLGWVTEGESGRTFRVGDAEAIGNGFLISLESSKPECSDQALAEVRQKADWRKNISRLARVLAPPF